MRRLNFEIASGSQKDWADYILDSSTHVPDISFLFFYYIQLQELSLSPSATVDIPKY